MAKVITLEFSGLERETTYSTDNEAEEVKYLLAEEKYFEARSRLIKLTEANPESGKYWRLLYMAERNLRNFDSGHKAISRAIEIAPDSRLYRELYALSLREIGQFEASIKELESLRDKYGDSEAVLEHLKVCYYKIGNIDQSIKYGRLGLMQRMTVAGDDVKEIIVDKNPTGRKVVSFSVWGTHLAYLMGAILNAKRLKILLPEWGARYYIGNDVPEEIVQALAESGAEIILQHDLPEGIPHYMWRFLVADDPAVSVFACRDTDSRITVREVAAMEEWSLSPYRFHIMRDHPLHNEPILAGLWGGCSSPNIRMTERIRSFMAENRFGRQYGVDQYFLKKDIWPLIGQQSLIHDRYYRLDNTQQFPISQRGDQRHIGECVVGMDQIQEECEVFGLLPLLDKFRHLPVSKAMPA